MSLLRPLTGLVLLASAAAHAHPGHGAVQDSHWHATDTSGFLLVAVLAGLALWLSRRGD
jgi:hypothetical protein